LPWSTANEDLVELFETTGQVELAEILFDGTRSKGCGVVQFGQTSEAETAIGMLHLCVRCQTLIIIVAKFQLYMYGGRPLGMWLSVDLCRCSLFFVSLDVRFNDRWHTFTPSAAKGGQVAPMQPEGM